MPVGSRSSSARSRRLSPRAGGSGGCRHSGVALVVSSRDCSRGGSGAGGTGGGGSGGGFEVRFGCDGGCRGRRCAVIVAFEPRGQLPSQFVEGAVLDRCQ